MGPTASSTINQERNDCRNTCTSFWSNTSSTSAVSKGQVTRSCQPIGTTGWVVVVLTPRSVQDWSVSRSLLSCDDERQMKSFYEVFFICT
ncbi:hypothetical protein ElyMa_003722800 [Elysia marginata]|uniref:Uncharacterized protein n=1 Tax=Elysia marginata TaxID=1093978 RepID=A0AAV4F5M8_9GAST|nr:hypothetical protein ElyMa_003722800 [Elysia marginata]